MLRWGVISTAAINDLVLPGFGRSQRSELLAVASRDQRRADEYARANGIPRAYGSYEGLLTDEEIDCVYISLPNHLHAEWTRNALEAGKHVLCEKPLTPTVGEAEELFRLAQERSLVLMEAFMYRHHPQTHRAAELVGSGAIGEPRVVRSWFHFTVDEPQTDIRYRADMFGGALRDVGCYCVSFSNHLLGGAPERVGAVAAMADSGVDERFAASMVYAAGAVALFDCSIQAPLHIGLTVLASDGSLHIPTPWYPHQPPQKILLTRGDVTEEVQATGEDSYFLEIENFGATVDGEGQQEVTRAETLRNTETINRLLEAAGLAGG